VFSHPEPAVQLASTDFYIGFATNEPRVRLPPALLARFHRAEAARCAGLSAVPCWVRELDDPAAYMPLVTSNQPGRAIGARARDARAAERPGHPRLCEGSRMRREHGRQ
jgi:hypothetical protein